MSYCSKCGTEIDEDIAFCPTCGNSIRQSSTKMKQNNLERGTRKPRSTLAVVLIILLVSTSIILAITFLPLRGVDVNASRSVPYQTSVDTIALDFVADVARINVVFEDLEDNLVTLHLSILGNVGAFAPSSLYDLAFEKTVVDNVLTVTSELDVADLVWPSSFMNLNVTCDLRIDYTLNASINIKTSVGRILADTRSGTVLTATSLETTTGSVEVTLVTGVILSDDISLTSTTGGVKLNWNNIIAKKDLQLDITTTTGSVDVDIEQDSRLQHEVTLNAAVKTGGVDLNIDLQGAVGAKIESTVTTGGINIERQIGFSGTNAQLQSDNYPADSDFEVNLQTTTGGINIDAKNTS